METPRAAPAALAGGIFVLAGSVLLLEIALTRVFAITMWNHFTYLVVSIALTGFGAAGTILTLQRQALNPASPARALALLAAGYGASVMVALQLVTHLPVNTIEIWSDKTNLVRLAGVCGVVFVPFLLGGAAIGLALTRFARDVSRLYFIDLLGSAAGGAASVWLVARFGSGETVVLAGALGLGAAALFALGASGRFRWLGLASALVAGVVAIGVGGGVPALGIPALAFPIPIAPLKEVQDVNPRTPLVRLFSPTAEVEVAPQTPQFPLHGGDFGAVDVRGVRARLVGQDGTAPTQLVEKAANLAAFPFLDDSQTATGYVARATRTTAPPSVLVIGVGGGMDVMIALAHGARQVTAVEINGAMIDMVTDRFNQYLGGLFDPAGPFGDRIRLHHADGRSYVRSEGGRYDLIQLSGVDSFTALSTGAYTLSEAYLYTVEAVQDLYARLEPDGYINFSRFAFLRPKKPRETLRLANIAYTALAELGVEDPAAHIAVFQGLHWASTIIKRGRFQPEEIAALQAFAEREGFWGLVFDPLHDPAQPYPTSARQLHEVRKRVDAALAAHPLPAGSGLPPSEDVAGVLADAARRALAGDDAGAAATLDRLVAPVPAASRDAVRAAAATAVDGVVAISRGADAPFHQTRQDFQQVLRAAPAERARFIADYEYDLSPSRDDSPFFFNYYRYSGLLDWGRENTGVGHPFLEKYHPDFPVGHAVLLASQLQVMTLAALMILLPLPFMTRAAGATPAGRGKVFAYFAALGAGFMALEMVLMQKLVLFLGHPSYAASVVLSSLLAAAGLGSMLSGRIAGPRPRTLGALAVAIVVMLATVSTVVFRVFPELAGWPLGARIAVTVAVLTPLGLVLGMPFPLGIRTLEARAPELVPWGWGINAFLSVVGSLLAITASMAFGFTVVLVAAASIYAVGFLAFVSYVRSAEPASTDAARQASLRRECA